MNTNIKTRIICLLLALIMMLAVFTSCNIKDDGPLGSGESISDSSDISSDVDSNTATQETEKKGTSNNKSEQKKEATIVTTTADGGKEVMVKSDPNLTPLTISTGSTSSYKIVSFYNTSLSSIKTFISGLKTKTGVSFTPTVISNTTGISGKQIVIGSFSNLTPLKGAPAFKSWTGAAVTVSGNTIYIAVAEEALLGNILTSFVNKIQKVGTNGFGVAGDLKFAYDKCAISEYLPTFVASVGTNKGLYSSGGGNYQLTYKNVNASDVSNYCSKLIRSGFSLHQQNMINTNSFYLYVKGDSIVHVNWFAKLKQFSIVYGPKTYLPAKKAVTGYSKKVTPTITQLALGETGTSIVIQLEDGSFVLIDGGLGSSDNYAKDSKTLWDFLSSKVVGGEKPRITWVVTHIHTDHRQLFQQFMPKYKDKIKLELVAWNMPDFNEIDAKYSPNWKEGETKPAKNYATPVATLNNIIKTNYPGTPIYTFHTGEKLYLPGCEIEFLTCHEDYYLNNFVWINDTSSAFRITMQGKTMMVFGDCTADVNNKIMTAAFGNYIKSDIMQITHHGVGGGTLATFKAVDPDICLWSLNKNKFDSDVRATGSSTKNPENVWLRASSGSDGQRARKHYHHSSTTTITIPSMAVSVTKVYTDR